MSQTLPTPHGNGVGIGNPTGEAMEVQTAFPDTAPTSSSNVPEQHLLESIGEVGPIQQVRKRRRRQKKKHRAQASAAEVQTALLDATNELVQPQRSVPFSPSTEGALDSSSMVSAQQSLESVGEVEPVRRTHQEERWQKFLEMKRQRAPSKKDNMRFKRVAKAMKNTMTVPVELVDLRPSMKPRHEPRAFRHEELTRLGIKTIQWDGL